MGGKVVKAVRFKGEVSSALILPRENIPENLWKKVKSKLQLHSFVHQLPHVGQSMTISLWLSKMNQ
jgi:hypothetical protein